ncbi:MAG: metallophosphoesterase [Paludibacteraceae bacterium]|nr:metallophosphoesterase [Paludibacteraceae bacterium]MBN2787446.1 metallophosphoesterase [Paludibacteraceae bacterium]
MKISNKLLPVLFVILSLTVFVSCDKSEPSDAGINPFLNGGNERNMIVVISDIHLGADLAYAECNVNLKPLEEFLQKVRVAPNVKELVIAGDLLDEWYVPATINTYQGKDQRDFVQRIAVANKGVIDAFNKIIQEGKIKVTYVPGNHDLTVTEENVDLILPGINQARDNEQGLGTYSPESMPLLAIEHGHRYNFFCAPDPISNQGIAPGTISPPGYFFTRIAALHHVQDCYTSGDVMPVVTQNTSGDASQYSLFVYWNIWKWAINALPIENKFDEDMIVTNFDGFTGAYSINDLLPFQTTPDGFIEVGLYNGIQDTWNQRQALNHVPVNIPVNQAIANSALSSESDNQAKNQYFLNPNSNKRIVIFGHTHEAKIISSENYNGQKSIYANSGTWIDNNNVSPTTMNFIVITPQNANPSSKTFVKLYSFKNSVVTKMAEDSIRY